MQCLKSLNASKELKILRCLKLRASLTEKEENYYSNLEKGFEGELKFNDWLNVLTNDAILLNDLLFQINNNHLLTTIRARPTRFSPTAVKINY